MKRILTILALILGLCPNAARADFNATAGSGLVVFGFTCFSTKVCTAWVPINSAGTELFTGANPGIAAGSGTAGSAATGVLTVQGIASMTPLIVTNSGTFAVQAAQSGTWNVTNISGTVSLPTGAATAANQATEIGTLGTIAANTGTPLPGVSNAQTSAAAAVLVAKASAGSIISISGSAASGSYILVFDATTAPADGAVTPKKCWGPMAAAGPFAFGWGVGPVFPMATGITIVSSSTGCFTKTATNAAFIAVEYQ